MSSNSIYALPSESAGPVAAQAQDAAHRSWLDRIGIGASLACAIHCMAAPFLMLLLPAAGATWSHPAVHWVLAVLVLPLALWVIYRGYLKHRKRWTLYTAAAGSACIVAGLITPMIFSQPLFSIKVPGISATAVPKVMLASTQASPFSLQLDTPDQAADKPVLSDPLSAGATPKAKPAGSCSDPSCCPSKKGETLQGVATMRPATIDSTDPDALASAAGPKGAGETAVCTDPACCPTITKEASTGSYTLAIPPGGLITLIGSLLLVFAHTSNLVACRCYTKSAKVSGASCGSDCGCPSA